MLLTALNSVLPASSDGRIIPYHAYVYCSGATLWATEGKMWAKAPLTDLLFPFCVRAEALKLAVQRDGATLASDGDYGVRVRYRRGSARLKGVNPEAFPQLAVSPAIQTTYSLPPDFKVRVADLLSFAGNSDAHIWQQGVHITPDYMMAASAFAAVRLRTGGALPVTMTIPRWACEYMAAVDGEPDQLHDRGTMISLSWPSGVELFTTLLIQEPPENILRLVGSLPTESGSEVPEGLKDSLKRLADQGATKFKLGNGRLHHATDELEVEDEIASDEQERYWSVKPVLAALDFADKINLSEVPAKWHGKGYDGIFAGMSG